MSTALLVMWMWAHGQALGSCLDGDIRPISATEIMMCSDGHWEHIKQMLPPGRELVDAPAVQETKHFNICGEMSELDWHHYEQRPLRSGATLSCVVVTTYDTCSDKSRVLLTSEDGAKHCVKFGGR